MAADYEDIQLINRLRREQDITNCPVNWDEDFKYADPATQGVLSYVRSLDYRVPSVGFELTNTGGGHVCDLELAWADIREGIYIKKPAMVAAGWSLFSIEEALHPTEGLKAQNQLPF